MNRKREDSDSSVVESSKESTEAHHQSKKSIFYMINAVILQIVSKIYVQWSTSTCRKKKNLGATYRATRS